MMSSSTALLVLLLLSLLPSSAVSLTCYKCVYPVISPLECQPFPEKCAAEKRCLYSTAVAVMDSNRYVLENKGCALASECGISGKRHAAGLVFTYITRCCDRDLCNAAATQTAAPCWSPAALSLGSTVLAVMLASV